MRRTFLSNAAPFTEAQNWPQTVTLTASIDYTDDDDDRTITSSGTATFAYERVMLSDLIAYPKLLFSGFADTFGPLNSYGDPDSPKFAVAQCGAGRMPGWLIAFYHTTQKDAFTTTTVFKRPDPQTGEIPDSTTTHQDVTGSITMQCAPCAPGRFVFIGDFETDQVVVPNFAAVNAGFYADSTDDDGSDEAQTDDVDVTLLSPGFAADPTRKQPEIPPVYRVTLPADMRFLAQNPDTYYDSIPFSVNGVPANYFTDVYSNFVGTVLGEVIGGLNYQGDKIGSFALRSPWVADVQMLHFGDVLTAGPVSYYGAKRNDSYVNFGSTAGGGGYEVIDDPFDLSGQSFTKTDDDSGLTVSISF